MAEASALIPGWLMPFWGTCTSSRLPISYREEKERRLQWRIGLVHKVERLCRGDTFPIVTLSPYFEMFFSYLLPLSLT